MIELFYKLDSNPKKYLDIFKVEILALNNITNEELISSSAIYDTVLYQINDKFVFGKLDNIRVV